MKPYFLNKPVGLGKIRIALPTEPTNNIGAEHDVRPHGADTLDQGTILFVGVGAIHQAQDAVAAGLKRQMNLLADIGMCHHGFEQREWKVFGMRGGKPHTLDARYIRHGRDQLRKIPVAEPVGIDVLPQECNLLEPLLSDPLGFLNDPLWIAGTFTASSVGNHTETAEIVTAPHDGDPCVHSVGSVRYHIVIGLIFRQIDCESLLIQPLFLREHRVAD